MRATSAGMSAEIDASYVGNALDRAHLHQNAIGAREGAGFAFADQGRSNTGRCYGGVGISDLSPLVGTDSDRPQ